jgi:hypothetical protein
MRIRRAPREVKLENISSFLEEAKRIFGTTLAILVLRKETCQTTLSAKSPARSGVQGRLWETFSVVFASIHGPLFRLPMVRSEFWCGLGKLRLQ